MLSMPPATTISASPRATAWAARATAFKPEPHTLLMVVGGEGLGAGGAALPLHYRARVAEAQARHLLHETAGDEGDDGQPRRMLAQVAGELRLLAATGLAEDHQRPGLRIGLPKGHQFGEGAADD